MAVKGITKIRNEVHIIKDTLNNWAAYCDAGIHVYCDCCTDGTAELCREHPAVVEVIESNLMDPDRERAEYFNRQQLLNSARRFIGPRDWVAYFDGDEHLYGLEKELFTLRHLRRISTLMFETYITPEDQELSEWQYQQRRWCGDEFEYSPIFFRNTQWIGFFKPDQRNMEVGPPLRPYEDFFHGKCRHWGKGLSVKKWDEKCEYYSTVFGPKYAEKWNHRKGKAVHQMSDFGRPLVLWDDLLAGKVSTVGREHLELVS